jgi:hypothetical protein
VYCSGQVIGGYEETITPEYIGIIFGLANWGPFPPGSYKAAITYGGEEIYDNEYKVSGLALQYRPAAEPGYMVDLRLLYFAP